MASGEPVVTSETDAVINIDMSQITAIGLSNLFFVKSYGISVVDGRTMHLIEFHDGGRFELTYIAGPSGELKLDKCSGDQVTGGLSGSTLMIGQKEK